MSLFAQSFVKNGEFNQSTSYPYTPNAGSRFVAINNLGTSALTVTIVTKKGETYTFRVNNTYQFVYEEIESINVTGSSMDFDGETGA